MKWLPLLLLTLFPFSQALAKNYVQIGIHGTYDLDEMTAQAPSEDAGGYAYYVRQAFDFEDDLKKQAGDSYGIHMWEDEAEYNFTQAIEFAPTYEARAYVIYKAWRYEMFPVDETTGEFESPMPYSPKDDFQDNAGAFYKAFKKAYRKIKNPGERIKRIKAVMDAVMTPDY